MGESTIEVRQHYLSRGFDLSPDFKDAPDHISAELEFMHVLVMQGLEAINESDHQLLSVTQTFIAEETEVLTDLPE